MSLINTTGILANTVDADTAETEADTAPEAVMDVSDLTAEEKVEAIQELASKGISAETLPETMTEEQMKALIEVANRYNPKNVQTKENTGNTVHIFNGRMFAPPTAVLLGVGDGNKGYTRLLSKKVGEAMMDKRVTDLLRSVMKNAVKYPQHVQASAELLLAMASIARVVYIHGVEGTVVQWKGPVCKRNINPAACILSVVTEYLHPLYQMGSYWLPAQGLSKSDRKHLGFDILPPVVKEEVKTD